MRMLSTLAALFLLIASSPAAARQAGEGVRVDVRASAREVAPGGRFAIAVVFDHEAGWHIHLHEPVVPPELAGFEPIRTEIVIRSLTGGYAGAIQWPRTHMADVAFTGGDPVPYGVYDGHAVAYIPVLVDADATGEVVVELALQYQVCDDSQCLMPVYPDDPEAQHTVRVAVRDGVAAMPMPALFADFDTSVFDRMREGVAQAPAAVSPPKAAAGTERDASGVPVDFLGYQFSVQTWMIWPIAFLAGLILNLTPCVLPVIPIKILSLQQHAKEPQKLLLFGMVYCVGIVAFFGVLAVLVGFFGQAWGQLNGYWWFSVPLAAIVAAMGLSMLGLFSLRLPNAIYAANPSGDTVGGNFMLGILTAILSTPCTGPMLAAVMAWGATQAPAVGVMAVLVMGVGMAAPYAVLVAFPRLIERVPRTGPGSALLKEVLGLLMLSVAVYVLSFLTSATWTWWFVGLFAAAAFVWMYVGGLRVLKGINGKIVVTHGAILGLIVTGVMTRAMTAPSAPVAGVTAGAVSAIPWRVFTGPEDGSIGAEIDRGLAEGRTVVVDFTAKWCANCHVIEKTVLNSAEGREILTSPRVLAIKVDLTSSRYAEGWGILQEFSGAASIPYLVVMGEVGGRADPVKFASFFKPSDLTAAVQRASNGRVGNGREIAVDSTARLGRAE